MTLFESRISFGHKNVRQAKCAGNHEIKMFIFFSIPANDVAK